MQSNKYHYLGGELNKEAVRKAIDLANREINDAGIRLAAARSILDECKKICALHNFSLNTDTGSIKPKPQKKIQLNIANFEDFGTL